jgi:hypothetical protein
MVTSCPAGQRWLRWNTSSIVSEQSRHGGRRKRAMNSISRTRAAVGIALACALLATSGTNALANSDSSSSHGIVGAWVVEVTLRNCTTQAPMGTFSSLVTFHRGGTMSETTGSAAFVPGQRSDGHGAWTRQRPGQFLQSLVALIRFTTEPNLPGSPGFDPSLPVSPGFFAGWQTISHTVTQTDANHMTSAGTNAFYKSDGELYRTGCSTAVGQRFE